jgi:hypothetical protein
MQFRLKLHILASKAAVFWSDTDGSFEKLPTTVSGDFATVQVTHFSKGFVGDGTGSSVLAGGGNGGGTQPCPIGTWSSTVTGQGTCDGGEGKISFTIAAGNGGTLAVTQNLVNIQTGVGCGLQLSGTATYEGNTVSFDFAFPDNSCTKHQLSTGTVDATCSTLSTNGEGTMQGCESCIASTNGSGCSGCGTASCTANYGPGTFTKE